MFLQELILLKIATHYKTEDGKIIDYFTSSTSKLYDYEAIYTDLPGWTEDITTARTFDELPENAKRIYWFYQRNISELMYTWFL